MTWHRYIHTHGQKFIQLLDPLSRESEKKLNLLMFLYLLLTFNCLRRKYTKRGQQKRFVAIKVSLGLRIGQKPS